jgi:hypothetical protein
VVESYDDDAVSHMEKNVDGKLAVTRVGFTRASASRAKQPTPRLAHLRALAPECFIANSVKTEVSVAPAS